MNANSNENADRSEPAYLENYGLSEAPFSILHKDKFLYLDAEHSQCLDLLRHMTDSSNLLLLVEGERDAGKTSLLTRFVINANLDWSICQIAANTMMDADQLLFQVAQGFGLERLPHDATQLQELLYAHVASMHRNGQIPILIVDDAHELAKDALLAIFNLADAYVEEQHLLRILLFCEPQIEKILGAGDISDLRDRITHTMQIPPLDEQSTAEYLKHRMAVAGFDGGSPFTPEMVRRLYNTSHDLPGVINKLAHQILEQGDFSEVQPDSSSTLHEYKKPVRQYAYVVVAVLLIVIIVLFQSESGEDITIKTADDIVTRTVAPDDDMPVVANNEQITTGVPDVKQKIIPLNPQALAENAQQATEQSETTQITHTEPDPVVTEIPEPTAVIDTNETAADFRKPQESIVEKQAQSLQLFGLEPESISGSAAPQAIIINGQGFTDDSDVIVSWSGNEKKLNEKQVSVISDTQIKISITTGENADNWTLRVTDPVNGKSNLLAFQVAAAKQEPVNGKKWILSRSPGAFTLQLFGSNHKTNAESFISKHAIQKQATYFHSLRGEQDWYSVIYGEYSDQQAASNAIKALPTSLKNLKPWIRRFDDIHASINSSSKLAKIVQNKPKPLPAAAPLSANASAKEYAAWLWSQDPSNYTLQLLGARQVESVRQFLLKYAELGGKAIYFHTRHDQQDWYTVVYGVYADKEAAKRAIDRLPAELKLSSPWVRSFASIHAELDRTQ
jgi:DamX protein